MGFVYVVGVVGVVDVLDVMLWVVVWFVIGDFVGVVVVLLGVGWVVLIVSYMYVFDWLLMGLVVVIVLCVVVVFGFFGWWLVVDEMGDDVDGCVFVDVLVCSWIELVCVEMYGW